MPGLLSKKGEDLTITRKLPDGTTMTVKSPNGSMMEMSGLLGRMVEGPVNAQSSMMGYEGGGMIGGRYMGPVEDNVPISANPGEYVVNVPATMKYGGLLEQINNEGRQMLARGGYDAGDMVRGRNRARTRPGGGFNMPFEQAQAPVVSPEDAAIANATAPAQACLLYTSPSPRDRTRSRMPSSA